MATGPSQSLVTPTLSWTPSMSSLVLYLRVDLRAEAHLSVLLPLWLLAGFEIECKYNITSNNYQEIIRRVVKTKR